MQNEINMQNEWMQNDAKWNKQNFVKTLVTSKTPSAKFWRYLHAFKWNNKLMNQLFLTKLSVIFLCDSELQKNKKLSKFSVRILI